MVLYFILKWFSLATFDVQNGNAMVNSTTGEACFTCYFLEGSQSQGCYIEYNSLITDYYSGNITIVRTSVDVSSASKCVSLSTSNYTVTFYDLDYNNVPYTTEYAVKLTDQLMISPIAPIQTSTSFIILPTHITSLASSTLLPTIQCTNCTNSKSL